MTAGQPLDPQAGDVWGLPETQAPQAFLYWPDPTAEDSADPFPWMLLWPAPVGGGDERWFRTRGLPAGLALLVRGGRWPERPYRSDDIVEAEDGRRWVCDVDEVFWDVDPEAFRQCAAGGTEGVVPGWVRFGDLPAVVLVGRGGRAVAR